MNEYQELIAKFLAENEIELEDDKLTTLSTSIATKAKTEVKLESVKAFLEKDDAGKEYYNNTISTTKQAAIDEFKTGKDYKSAIEIAGVEAAKLAEVKVREELGKKLTPDQKKIKELEERQAQTDAQLKLKDITISAAGALEEKKLSKDFIDFVLDPLDEIKTLAKVDTLSEIIQRQIKVGVEEEFKKIGKVPDRGDGTNPVKVTKAMMDKAADTARATGRVEDRVEYAKLKRIYNSQKEE